MILEVLLNFIKSLLFFVFGWINIPSLPQALEESLSDFLDIVFGNLSVLGFFIRPATLSIIIPLSIVLINFDKIYNFVMFILRKIPFLDIK